MSKPKITLDPKYQYSELDNRKSAVIKKVSTVPKFIPKKFLPPPRPIDPTLRQRRELNRLHLSSPSSSLSSSPIKPAKSPKIHKKPIKKAYKPNLPPVEYSTKNIEILTRGKQIDYDDALKKGLGREEIGLMALKGAIQRRGVKESNILFGEVIKEVDERKENAIEEKENRKREHKERRKILGEKMENASEEKEQEKKEEKVKKTEEKTEKIEEKEENDGKEKFEWGYWKKKVNRFMRFMQSKICKEWAKVSIREERRYREKAGGDEEEGEWREWDREGMMIYKKKWCLFWYWRLFKELPEGDELLKNSLKLNLEVEEKKKKRNKLIEEVDEMKEKARIMIKEKEEKRKKNEKVRMLESLDLI